MEIAGFAGIFASLLGLALTVYGVFFNSRATRALINQLHGETQTAAASTQAAVEATQALIESTHRDSRVLLEAIRADIKAVSENGQRRHDDLVTYMKDMDGRHLAYLQDMDGRHLAYLQDMDRRHTEILAAIARRP